MLKFLVLQENGEYQVHDLKEGTTTIGRDLGNEIVLTSKKISRKHASLTKSAEGWILEDLQSTQGTFVNGNRITKQLIQKKDEIRIADINCVLANPEDPHFKIKTDDSIVMLQKSMEKNLLTSEFDELKQFIETTIKTHVAETSKIQVSMDIKSYLLDLEGHLENKLLEMKCLIEINKILGPHLEFEALLHRVLKLSLEFFNAERGFVMLFDETSGKLKIKAARNLSTGQSRMMESFSEKVVQKCFSQKELILVSDAQVDSELKTNQSIVEMAVRSLCVIPLVIKENIYGVIYLDHLKKTHMFKHSRSYLYSSFGDIVAICVQNSLKYEKTLAKVLI